VRQGALALAAALAGVLLAPPPARAQTSPLTLVPSNGRVGIGTTTPSELLHVFTASGTGGIRLSANATNTNLRVVDEATGGLRVQNGAGTNILAVDNSNLRVGIGTTTPSELLHVAAGSNANAGVRISSNAGNTNTILKVVDGATGGLQIQNGGGTALMAFDNVYLRVGIAKPNPLYTLDVNGTLSASVKQFRIPHPLDPAGKDLTHASLEGPEIGVYYRGQAQLDKGEAVVSLPLYFEALTEPTGRTVQLTPVGGWAPLYVVSGVQGGRFTVRAAAGGDPSQRFYWEVKAVRRDVPALLLEPPKNIGPPTPPQPATAK
jgi:hypothetical protein